MGRTNRGWRRAVRWFLAGSGELKRGSDRVEMLFRLLVLVALLTAAPVGVLAATATYQAAEASDAAQHARDHQRVRAVVLRLPEFADSAPPEAMVEALVAWTAPDGTPSSASVPVPATVRTHDRVPVWSSADGRLTGPPADGRASVGHTAWTGLLTGLTAPVAGWLLLGLTSLALAVHRSRRWAREWLAVEPVWTSRRPMQ